MRFDTVGPPLSQVGPNSANHSIGWSEVSLLFLPDTAQQRTASKAHRGGELGLRPIRRIRLHFGYVLMVVNRELILRREGARENEHEHWLLMHRRRINRLTWSCA